MMSLDTKQMGYRMRTFRVSIALCALATLGWAALAGAGDLGPLEKFKDDAKPSIEMNPDGKKFKSFDFDHAAHITEPYLADGSCSSCHHTQTDASAAPKPCRDCHAVDGDAGETKPKAKAFHSKKSKWDGPDDDGGVSCLGCHKAHNKAVTAGSKQGGKAPSKCAGCHEKKKK
jgi:hypothetical protein